MSDKGFYKETPTLEVLYRSLEAHRRAKQALGLMQLAMLASMLSVLAALLAIYQAFTHKPNWWLLMLLSWACLILSRLMQWQAKKLVPEVFGDE